VSYVYAAVYASDKLTPDLILRDAKGLTLTTTFRCNPMVGAL
jgi:hypothetical protein